MTQKVVVPLFIVLLTGTTAFAQIMPQTVSVTNQATHGPYSNSTQRKSITSGAISLIWLPNLEMAMGLKVHTSHLNRKPPLPDIQSQSSTLSLTWVPQSPTGHYNGVRTAVTYLDVVNESELTNPADKNAEETFVSYLSLIYKPPDLSRSFDIGFTQGKYHDTEMRQSTVTIGSYMLNYWVWSQMRLYHVDLSNPVQGEDHSNAFEEKLTYYAIPQKLSLTFFVLFGERIYTYDPDLQIAYTLPDIQRGSTGLSAIYNITPRLNFFGDLTYETYQNRVIQNDFTVLYETVGLTYIF